ncbi:hypothetical protein DdX_11248 [Ditylenchus destructor]|uniref:Uncharacterized protein n=1 Tax=Ditylenchus destructor TaxID=166010 RepID=A0AAD4R4J2_9BILA|nr:hypothetical protein DdX_11248 [Ditylenchus destructor]
MLCIFEYVKEFIKFIATGNVRVALKKDFRLGKMYSLKGPEEISRCEDLSRGTTDLRRFRFPSRELALYTSDKVSSF